MNERRSVAGAQPLGDPDLVRTVASGDLAALGELYDRYARDVWHVAHRVLPDGGDAEDVVHAVFMKLPEIAPSYDGRASCRNWLCGIAVRVAMRQRRGAGRLRRMLDVFAHEVFDRPGADPERTASGKEQLAILAHALKRLSEKKRVVFVLVELEGLSAEDAAVALEIPAATVRTRLFGARRDLQEALRNRGVR
jgi:RNA polymerase sigma-70 factor, ECF subfamily